MTRADEISPPTDRQWLIGTWRRFGDIGPVYQILAFDRCLGNGEWLMRVRVLESGEEVDYKLSDLDDDPRET